MPKIRKGESMKTLLPKTQEYIKYAENMEANKKVISWCKTTLNNVLKRYTPTIEEVEHVIDYLVSDKAPIKLHMVSYIQAVAKAYQWSENLQKQASEITESKKDTKVVLDFKDGFKIVQLIGKNAYQREGNLMRNCVASYYGRDTEIYSLRDKFNNPHCTMEKNQQIKGKGNGDIHPKYVDYVVQFLEWAGMKVRDSEMAHLGYEVIQFGEYCLTPCYRNRYVKKGQEVKYSDKVIIFTDFHKASHYKGNKICLFKGDFKIKEREKVDFGKIQQVGGYLSINSNAELKAENLKSVGGNLSINSNAELPNLKSVGGDLSISSNAELKAENLKSVGGNLYINSNAELPNLKSVGGYLSIYSNAELNGIINPTKNQLKKQGLITKGKIIYR
ncbi:MAG: PcfJ domain-containing protein [Patescibacteria group bacterium]|nr:PcfJ domain-containing protein [Patescibacteria group bacterium]